MRRLILSSVIFILTLFLIPYVLAQEIKIGVITTLTGAKAPIGERQKRGYELALEEINAEGGIDGHKVVLIYKDDKGKPQKAIKAFEDLVSQQVAAVIGTYSSFCTFEIAGLAERYKIPLLSPCAAADKLTKQGFKWFFRLNAPVSDYIKALIKFIAELHPKAEGITIVREDTPFGFQIAERVKRKAKELRVKVIKELYYSPGSPEFYSLIGQLKEDSLVLLISKAADASEFLKECEKKDFAPFAFLGIGAGFLGPNFIKNNQAYLITPTQWVSDVNWPGAKEFARKYQIKYQEPAEYHSAEAYAALKTISKAIQKAKCHTGDIDCRKKIKKALQEINILTAFGPVRFVTSKGYTNQNLHPVLIVQIQQKQPATVWPPEYATADLIYPFPGWKKKETQ